MNVENTNVLEWIPYAFRDIEEFEAIAAAENFEFNELHKAINDMMCDQFVNQSTETGIKRWEKMLGINPVSAATLDERRWEILNRLNIKIPYTFTMLKNRLATLYGDNFSLKVISDTYTVKVRILQEQIKTMASTRTMLEVIVPANMVIDLNTIESEGVHSTSTAVLGRAVLGAMKLGQSGL